MKVYSKLDTIPNGLASDKITKGCLVLEGGAFRGLYSQGAMDALMIQDINFECTIGVSAGALGGMNYVSGQIGRSARMNLAHRHDSAYIGAEAIQKSKSPVRLDYLMTDYEKIEPFNRKRFFDKNRRFIAVASNCITGKADYFDKDESRDIFKAVEASASMPYITPMVYLEDPTFKNELGSVLFPHLDGGCSCKIAYQWAIDQGYDNIIIIKTRENGFRKKSGGNGLAEKFYKDYPAFAKSLMASNDNYNMQCDEIEVLERNGRAFVLSPSKQVTVSRLEGDMEKLGDLYWLGYNDMLNAIPKLKEYLEK